MVKAGQLSDVATPAAVLDRDRFLANCRTMVARIHAAGSRLRPHMKTLKSIDAARFAVDPAHGGIAVATLNEAEYFAEYGVSDICIAVCLSPDKMQRAASVARKTAVSIFVDSMAAARAVMAQGAPLGAWVEIDCGEHRTGVDPESKDLVQIADVLGDRLVGVATHAGQSYNAANAAEIRAIAEQERQAVVAAAARLRSAGHRVTHVSAGSTPTAAHAVTWQGVTEVRAGVYMAGDMVQVGLGSLGPSDPAFSVLSTVISTRPDAGQIVVDAGGLALSKDRGDGRWGYGLVLDIDGVDRLGGVTITDVHQEHGEIRGLTPAQAAGLAVGTKVRILPNHVCMTAAMYDELLVCDGQRLVGRWPRTNGWRER